jgi:hypothetical protein
METEKRLANHLKVRHARAKQFLILLDSSLLNNQAPLISRPYMKSLGFCLWRLFLSNILAISRGSKPALSVVFKPR